MLLESRPPQAGLLLLMQPSAEGMTALDVAQRYARVDCVELLRDFQHKLSASILFVCVVRLVSVLQTLA